MKFLLPAGPRKYAKSLTYISKAAATAAKLLKAINLLTL